MPLAVNTQVDITYEEGGDIHPVLFGEKVRESTSDGHLTVIIWKHDQLPSIAEGLGYKGMSVLDEDDFDTFFAFTYHSSDTPRVSTLSEDTFFGMPCATNATFV